jgi:hypothetical protein
VLVKLEAGEKKSNTMRDIVTLRGRTSKCKYGGNVFRIMYLYACPHMLSFLHSTGTL